MMRKKSKPEDEQIILDETADQVERASAASDGFGKVIHPVLEQWLNDSQYILRGKAISLLLGGFGFERYVKKAIELLRSDPEWEVKWDAASALSSYATEFEKGKKYEDTVMRELLNSLLNDANPIVQKRVYEYIYTTITGKSLFIEAYEFNRSKNVDWSLLKPYLEKYDLAN